jgi:hypothetical protein
LPLSVMIDNTGDLPLNCIVTWAAAASTTASNCLAIPSSGQFAVLNTCDGQLAAHVPCTITVQFVPNTLGPQTGTLWVYDAQRVQVVALSGIGVQPAALSVSSTSPDFSSPNMIPTLTFAPQNLTVASTPATLTITNTGAVAVINLGFGITGTGASSFSCGASICSATTCVPTLAPGGNCTVQISFNPGTTGESSASLTIAAGNVKAPVTVALSGSGQVPFGLNASPPQLVFVATVAGSSSAAQTVTVSNSSNFAASQLALSASNGFTLTQNTCPASLASGATCTVGVVFAPATTGAKTGTFSVMSPSIGTAASVTLSGTGALAAAIQVTSPSLTFPSTGVGETSGPITVTVTNTGAADPLGNLVLAVPSGFQLVNNNCAAALGPGASCTAGVEFAPALAGAQSGSLAVSSSTVANGVQVPLAGMGFDFTVTVSGASAQSVAGGLSASYTLVLTPLNGSSGAFTFACNALPAKAACVFNPTGETLNSGVTGNVTAQVSTASTAASARWHGARAWGLVPLVCGLVLLPMGRKRKRRVRDTILLLVLLAMLVGGVGSCASSGGGKGGGLGANSGGTTPAGTYSIPVTVTSTGVSHNATLTLTVD